MNEIEFLDVLREIEGEWRLERDGAVRLGYHCPLTAVCLDRYPRSAGRVRNADDWVEAWQELEIISGTGERIMFASDNISMLGRHETLLNRKLREQILAAVGLEEADGRHDGRQAD